MKKIMTIAMILILSVMVPAGCGDNGNQTPTPTFTEAVTPSQGPVNASNFIGEERAKEIALERAGITEDGVVFDRVELELDDGVWKYEVEFRQGTTEYDTNIKADDGTIILWEVDAN